LVEKYSVQQVEFEINKMSCCFLSAHNSLSAIIRLI